MDDFRRNNDDGSSLGYEPNFVLKDSPEKTADDTAAPDTPQHGGNRYGMSDTAASGPAGSTDYSSAEAGSENSGYTNNINTANQDASAAGQPGGFAQTAHSSQQYSGAQPAGIGSSGPAANTGFTGSNTNHSGSNTSADGSADTGSEGAFRDPRANFRQGDSCSWNNANGLGKVKRLKKERRKRKPSPQITFTRRTLALIIALCVVLSGAFGIGSAAVSNLLLSDNDSGSDSSGSVKTTGYDLEDATGSNMTVQEITAKAKDSVVEIKTESVSSDSWMQQYVTEGAGSGVIISKDGYIITNNHVIDGASKITVTTADEKEYSAKLVGTDSNSDVAVIKIKASNLTPATYGNSDQLKVGDMAVAIGNPLGELGGTVTAGIISALDRELSIDGKTMTLLQTDSSINPGNSGGGLFNGDGQLIGIVVAKSSGSDVEGLGFAIPVNKAAEVAQQLMKNGYVKGQAYTGMSYTEGSQQSDYGSFFSEDNSSSSVNVYIASVDSAKAKLAGFKAGDMVFAVDGKQITSFETLSSIITSHKAGDKVTFTIVRNGETKDIKLTLQEKKADTDSSDSDSSSN